MDIEQEINQHLQWIETLGSYLGIRDIAPDELEAITRHDRCVLGQWLDSEASAQFAGLPVLAQLQQSHEAFHRLAGEMIVALEAGDEEGAMAAQARFFEMSQQTIEHLQALRNGVDGAPVE